MKKNKNHRMKSRLRFTIFVAIMIMFTVTGMNTLIGLNDVSGQEEQQYVEVTVAYGDTLWSIAEAHMPDDMDQRKAVYIIKEHNEDINGALIPGQTIKVPTNNF